MVRGPFQEVQVALNRVLLGFHQGWMLICLGLRVNRGVRDLLVKDGQGLSAGSFQQGFLNPWANCLNQRQAQEFYNQQLLLQQQFRNAQSVPVPPSVSSTPGHTWKPRACVPRSRVWCWTR